MAIRKGLASCAFGYIRYIGITVCCCWLYFLELTPFLAWKENVCDVFHLGIYMHRREWIIYEEGIFGNGLTLLYPFFGGGVHKGTIFYMSACYVTSPDLSVYTLICVSSVLSDTWKWKTVTRIVIIQSLAVRETKLSLNTETIWKGLTELWFQVCNNIYILYIQVSYSFNVVSDLYLICYSETFQSYSFQLLSQILIFHVGSKP